MNRPKHRMSDFVKMRGVLLACALAWGVKRYWLAMAVAASLIGGGLSWPSVAQACTVTTTAPAQPSNLTATANPSSRNENGILLQWDAPAETDKVSGYDILRRKTPGGSLRRIGGIQNTGMYEPGTGTYTYPTSSPMEVLDPETSLEGSGTYVYRIVAARWSNCGGRQESARSDPVTATFP